MVPQLPGLANNHRGAKPHHPREDMPCLCHRNSQPRQEDMITGINRCSRSSRMEDSRITITARTTRMARRSRMVFRTPLHSHGQDSHYQTPPMEMVEVFLRATCPTTVHLHREDIMSRRSPCHKVEDSRFLHSRSTSVTVYQAGTPTTTAVVRIDATLAYKYRV